MDTEPRTVSMEIEPPSSWLTFVGATTSCRRALARLTAPGPRSRQTVGLAAWNYWIEELSAGNAVSWSHSYNAQCWFEARQAARDFTARLAGRHKALAGPIEDAHAAFEDVAEHLGCVAGACPFDFEFNPEPVTDENLIEELTDHLAQAKQAEIAAIDALSLALSL
jgi:hypothetical protein